MTNNKLAVLTFYQTTKSYMSQLKAFADDIIKVNEVLKTGLARVENIVGTRENAGYQHFLLFSCFQKPSVLGSVKVWILW